MLTGQLDALAGPSSLAGFTIDSEELIYYLNSFTGDVIELYNNDDGWAALNITTAAGAPPAALSGTYPSALTGFSYGLQSHVFFVGTNAHIYQLYEDDGGPWTYTDVSASAGGLVQSQWQLASFYYNSQFWVVYGSYLDTGFNEIEPLYEAVNGTEWIFKTEVSIGNAGSLISAYADTESNASHIYCINGETVIEAFTAAGGNTFTDINYNGQPPVIEGGDGIGGSFH